MLASSKRSCSSKVCVFGRLMQYVYSRLAVHSTIDNMGKGKAVKIVKTSIRV